MKTQRRSDSILYKRWYQFATGTTNPNCYAWAAYGALGIKMKKSWTPFKSGFDQFEQYVIDHLGPPPTPEHVINRIDTTKDIKPGNLQWATRQQQCNHRRTNMMIRIGKETKSLADWCRLTGLKEPTVWSRIKDHGYPPKEALGL
jgi:predicted DNA-binding transcriptional regulator AlpA